MGYTDKYGSKTLIHIKHTSKTNMKTYCPQQILGKVDGEDDVSFLFKVFEWCVVIKLWPIGTVRDCARFVSFLVSCPAQDHFRYNTCTPRVIFPYQGQETRDILHYSGNNYEISVREQQVEEITKCCYCFFNNAVCMKGFSVLWVLPISSIFNSNENW